MAKKILTSFTWAPLSVERKALERMANHKFLLSRLEHLHLSTESKTHQLTNPLRAGQPHRCEACAMGPCAWWSVVATLKFSQFFFFFKQGAPLFLFFYFFIFQWAFQINWQLLPGSLLKIHSLRPHLRLLKLNLNLKKIPSEMLQHYSLRDTSFSYPWGR